MKKARIVVICGPTACGKTAIAVELAKLLDGEVISADSMQIYKFMDIGTAKPCPDQLCGIPHHLIDEINPDEAYNAAIFKNRAASLILDIINRNKIPIICGGTGFYINALLFDADFTQVQDSDPIFRANLEKIVQVHGAKHLHESLERIDPNAALSININNVKRVIRALEYHHLHGRPISSHNLEQRQKHSKPAYDAAVFVLNADRAQLYKRINRRVDKMAEEGLVDEVAALLKMGYSQNLVSMQGLGYKEIVKYLEGECTIQAALDAVKQGTRRFAKRQITWFKHQLPGGIWLNVDEYPGNFELASEIKINFAERG